MTVTALKAMKITSMDCVEEEVSGKVEPGRERLRWAHEVEA